jgi:CubicO group peptidase (beta-lactamase class C family)
MTTHESAADRRQFLAALAVAAATPSLAFGKTAGYPAIHALASRYVAEKSVANVVVAVGGRKGPPTFISSGTLELGAGAKAGPDSLYRIYSMSKCITACAIMLLIEDGKLTLDTPLSAIFPGYAQMKVLTDPEKSLASKPATKQITIRHIVTHTAGLAYVSNAPAPLKKFYEDLGINPSPSAFGDPRVPNNLSAFAEVTAFAPVLLSPARNGIIRSGSTSPALLLRRSRELHSRISWRNASSHRLAWSTPASQCPRAKSTA